MSIARFAIRLSLPARAFDRGAVLACYATFISGMTNLSELLTGTMQKGKMPSLRLEFKSCLDLSIRLFAGTVTPIILANCYSVFVGSSYARRDEGSFASNRKTMARHQI